MDSYNTTPPHRHHTRYSIIAFIGIIFGVLAAFAFTYEPHSGYIADIPNTNTITSITATPTQAVSDFCIEVPVLTYHHIQPFETAEPKNQTAQTVSPENFDWHMKYLKEQGYVFFTTDDLITALETHSRLPDNALIITLDDGYKDHYTYAFPIAQKYGIKLNIGIISGLTGNPEHLTVNQIQTMHASGLVHFVNHSWSHRSLKSSDVTLIEQQIRNPEEAMQEWIGTSSGTMIYPYGVYNDLAIETLRAEGMKAAFTLEPGATHCQSNMFALPRVKVGNAGPGVYNL